MTDRAEAKLNEAAGAIQEKFGEAIGSHKHQARGAARRYPAQASYAVQDAAACMVKSVRDNPTTGLAVAASVGVIIGFLLGRK
ncbi:CsbD family protein [Pantoea sp. Mb-10]|uniref:CsbD family protein n=1 Tax=Pantoea eucrina TaxID=472693 RepID=A0ABU5LFH8_9GAMM|nr:MULTISPECIES: CsbD family protein [Pantoea]MCE0490661.1 CsbD family protein [Pantoea sp. Mb-10]MCE0500181.1 CsbD family protein [Pantoea sp. Pb-8]MDZ7278713.1 CsbD family protein [Pantoea eucrina]